MSDIELKTCPFCGGKAKSEVYCQPMGIRAYVRIVCSKCGARSTGIVESPRYCAEEKAAEIWNRRVEHE